MKLTVQTRSRDFTLHAPNCLLLNRFSFWVLKRVLGRQVPNLRRLRFRQVRPLVRAIRFYAKRQEALLTVTKPDDTRIWLYL